MSTTQNGEVCATEGGGTRGGTGGDKGLTDAKMAAPVFSGNGVAESYLLHRPAPPPALVSTVVKHWQKSGAAVDTTKSLLLDVGCGSGQSTHLFAPHFSEVSGVDVSADMVEEGRRRYAHVPNLSLAVADAHQLPAAAASVDVLSVCAALHWFDLRRFYAEADRVLRPGGVLAAYSYVDVCPWHDRTPLRPITKQFRDGLGFFSPQHHHLETEFAELPALYPDDIYFSTKKGEFEVVIPSDLEGLMGYYSSFAPLLRYSKEFGAEKAQASLELARKRILDAIDADEGTNPTLQMKYSYFLRMWRKPSTGTS